LLIVAIVQNRCNCACSWMFSYTTGTGYCTVHAASKIL